MGQKIWMRRTSGTSPAISTHQSPRLDRLRNGSVVALLIGCLVAGCAKNPEGTAPATPPPQTATNTIPPAPESPPHSTPPAKEGPWFEDPRGELQKNGVELSRLPLPSVSAEQPPVVASTSPEKTEPIPVTSSVETPSPETAAGMLTIDPEIVKAGIKRAMLNLRQNLQSATVYGTQYKEVQGFSEELAILIVLAARSSSPPSWEQHAASLRDLSIEISQAARDLSPEAYKKAATAFESIDQLFQGNIPDGIPTDGTLDLPFSEFAHQLPLMRRLDLAQKQLKEASLKESDLRKNTDFLIEEAGVTGYLMQAMTEPGFSSADEEEYQSYAKALMEASASLQTAAREGKHADFQTALGALGKSCNDCHQDYRFNSE